MTKAKLVLSAALIAAGALSMADRAVVVGINDFAFIPNARLAGCENDANTMKSLLLKRGFRESEIAMLLSKAATKEAILSALDRAVEQVKRGERLVITYSSHGSQAGNGVSTLLTTSSTGRNFNGDITPQEIRSYINKAIAKNVAVTLLIDACHSEGVLTKSVNPVDPLAKKRFYPRQNVTGEASRSASFVGDKLGEVVTFNNAQNQSAPIASNSQNIGNGGPLCAQYAAAKYTQYAFETNLAGKRQGVFTYYLNSLLNNKNRITWAEVTAKVNGLVSAWSKDEQNPVFVGSPGYALEGYATAQAAQQATQPVAINLPTLNDLFNFDNVNGSVISIRWKDENDKYRENGSTIKMKGQGQDYSKFEIQVNKSGWLVVLDRDSKDQVQVMNFSTQSSEDVTALARVSAGAVVMLPGPAQDYYAFNQEGPERIKAILFTTEAGARSAISKIRQVLAKSANRGGLVGARYGEVIQIGTANASFYTADLRFQVVK
jgi:hypothetical protein